MHLAQSEGVHYSVLKYQNQAGKHGVLLGPLFADQGP